MGGAQPVKADLLRDFIAALPGNNIAHSTLVGRVSSGQVVRARFDPDPSSREAHDTIRRHLVNELDSIAGKFKPMPSDLQNPIDLLIQSESFMAEATWRLADIEFEHDGVAVHLLVEVAATNFASHRQGKTAMMASDDGAHRLVVSPINDKSLLVFGKILGVVAGDSNNRLFTPHDIDPLIRLVTRIVGAVVMDESAINAFVAYATKLVADLGLGSVLTPPTPDRLSLRLRQRMRIAQSGNRLSQFRGKPDKLRVALQRAWKQHGVKASMPAAGPVTNLSAEEFLRIVTDAYSLSTLGRKRYVEGERN